MAMATRLVAATTPTTWTTDSREPVRASSRSTRICPFIARLASRKTVNLSIACASAALRVAGAAVPELLGAVRGGEPRLDCRPLPLDQLVETLMVVGGESRRGYGPLGDVQLAHHGGFVEPVAGVGSSLRRSGSTRRWPRSCR